MSSSSIAPKVEGSPVSTAAVTPTIENGVLRLELPSEEEATLKVRLLSLEGKVPREEPWFFDRAESYGDRRGMSPLSMRFQETDAADFFANEDALRAAIWSALRYLMPGCTFPDDLPRIIFHDFKGNEDSLGRNTVDLVFPSIDAFECVGELEEINVGGRVEQRHTFTRTISTNSLPADIFFIDCLAFRLEQTTSKALFSALASMTAEIGSLVGIAKLLAAEQDWNLKSFPAFSGVVRGYVKLNLASMAAPLKDLVAKLPTLFVWLGISHQLLYEGHHLHRKPVYSPDYGLSTAAQAGTAASTTASTTPAPAQTRASGAEASNASKKRKKRSE